MISLAGIQSGESKQKHSKGCQQFHMYCTCTTHITLTVLGFLFDLLENRTHATEKKMLCASLFGFKDNPKLLYIADTL